MGFLKLIGAVSAAEHKELRDLLTTVSRERNDALIAAGEADQKFKLAINNLAARSEELSEANKKLASTERDRNHWREQAERDEEPAQKWRDRAARELQRGQAKRDAAAKVLPVSKFTKPIPAPTKAVAAKGKK